MLSLRTLSGLVFLLAMALAGALDAQPAAGAGEPAQPGGDAGTDYRLAGERNVAFFRTEWTDARRERKVPVKVYYPQATDQREVLPIIFFSHGLGGSREGYAYLGRHWASHGYVSVHLEHEGSDTGVWRGQADAALAMQKAAKDPANAINRPKDVSFAIDQMARVHLEAGPLQRRLDLESVAVAGHSFGGFTALALAGEQGTYVKGETVLADPRIRAAIVMSAPVPQRKEGYDSVYGEIAIPCLHMTGTLDEVPNAFTKAADRRIPYDNIHNADQFLVNFVGGDHTIFSGRVRKGAQERRDKAFQEMICMSTTAFLDAYLKENEQAKQWLAKGRLRSALGREARVEQKKGTAPKPSGPEPQS